MSVFKAVFKSIKSTFGNLILYFAIFTFFGNLSAKTIATTNETMFKESKVSVAIINNDESALSNGLVDYLKETQKVVNPRTDSLEDINENTRFGIYNYAVIIPEDFSEKLSNGDAENALEYISAGASTSEYLLTQKIDDYLKDVVIYLECGYSEQEAIDLTNKQMIKLEETKALVQSSTEEDHFSFFSGMYTFNAYSLMMILCTCISSALLFMKNPDVKNRISVSGMSFQKRNTAIITSVLLLGIILTLLCIVAVHILGFNYSSDKSIYYIINTFALMLIGIGMAYLITSITSSENIIAMLSNMLTLSMCFLCGVFVSTDLMSASVLKAAQFLPLYWYVSAVHYINDTPLGQIWGTTFATKISIEILFALIFFALGMIISRKKEQYAV